MCATGKRECVSVGCQSLGKDVVHSRTSSPLSNVAASKPDLTMHTAYFLLPHARVSPHLLLTTTCHTSQGPLKLTDGALLSLLFNECNTR